MIENKEKISYERKINLFLTQSFLMIGLNNANIGTYYFKELIKLAYFKHFGAARGDRDGPSPLPDDMRCPRGTDQGGTVEVLPPLTRVRGGFYLLDRRMP